MLVISLAAMGGKHSVASVLLVLLLVGKLERGDIAEKQQQFGGVHGVELELPRIWLLVSE
jgi:hypothetical protein